MSELLGAAIVFAGYLLAGIVVAGYAEHRTRTDDPPCPGFMGVCVVLWPLVAIVLAVAMAIPALGRLAYAMADRFAGKPEAFSDEHDLIAATPQPEEPPR